MQFQCTRLYFILNFNSVSQSPLLLPFFIKYTIIKSLFLKILHPNGLQKYENTNKTTNISIAAKKKKEKVFLKLFHLLL